MKKFETTTTSVWRFWLAILLVSALGLTAGCGSGIPARELAGRPPPHRVPVRLSAGEPAPFDGWLLTDRLLLEIAADLQSSAD